MRLSLMGRVCTLAIILLGVAAAGRPAIAQIESREGIALQNQVLELRRQVQALQDQISRGGVPGPAMRPVTPVPSSASDLTAQLLARVDALEDQVRQLRGRVDVLENTSQRQAAELNKRLDDLSFQMQGPQAAPGGSAPGASMPPPPLPPGQPPAAQLPPTVQPGSPGAATPPGQTPATMRRTPEVAMQEGNAALARRDYPAAEAAAREVLANRTSPRAYDAQFLLAQALAGERQYSQAAIAFDDAYNRSKKGIRAPDALLGLANALIAINEKKAACDTLAKLRVEFPTLRPDLHDGATSAVQRAGCR